MFAGILGCWRGRGEKRRGLGLGEEGRKGDCTLRAVDAHELKSLVNSPHIH